MLNSAINILSQYLDSVTPYNLHSIKMQRGENPEDLYYLCRINDKAYIVFETDYISDSAYQAQEAKASFVADEIKPLGWLAKKDFQSTSPKTLPPDTSLGSKENYEKLVAKTPGSYLLHAVLAVEANDAGGCYDPVAYGNIVVLS